MLVLYVVWGSTYLAVSVAVDTIPPFLMAGARFSLAGVLLLGWSLAREGGGFQMPARREWRDAAIVGTLLLGGGMGLCAFGQQTVPSGTTALLIALMPVCVAILGRMFLAQRLPRTAVIGILVGFVGIAILIGPTALGGQGALDPLGLGLIMLSPIAWAAGSLYASHRAVLPARPLVNTGLQMVSGGLALFFMATITGDWDSFDPATISASSVAAFAYLTVAGSLVAFTTYGWLLRKAPLSLVSTYAYVNPVVAVILGGLILGETIDIRTVVAGAVILVAVALIVTARGRMPMPRSTGRPSGAHADDPSGTPVPTSPSAVPAGRVPTA